MEKTRKKICENCGHLKERHNKGMSEFWNEYSDKFEYCDGFKLGEARQ